MIISYHFLPKSRQLVAVKAMFLGGWNPIVAVYSPKFLNVTLPWKLLFTFSQVVVDEFFLVDFPGPSDDNLSFYKFDTPR